LEREKGEPPSRNSPSPYFSVFSLPYVLGVFDFLTLESPMHHGFFPATCPEKRKARAISLSTRSDIIHP
jgi:hypothetical protein